MFGKYPKNKKDKEKTPKPEMKDVYAGPEFFEGGGAPDGEDRQDVETEEEKEEKEEENKAPKKKAFGFFRRFKSDRREISCVYAGPEYFERRGRSDDPFEGETDAGEPEAPTSEEPEAPAAKERSDGGAPGEGADGGAPGKAQEAKEEEAKEEEVKEEEKEEEAGEEAPKEKEEAPVPPPPAPDPRIFMCVYAGPEYFARRSDAPAGFGIRVAPQPTAEPENRKYCCSCGTPIDKTCKFCPECGAKQPGES